MKMVKTSKTAKIVKTSGVVGGKARVKGTRISVIDIVELYTKQEYTPERIATEFDLKPEQVFKALQYYYEYPKEVRKNLKKRRKLQKKEEVHA